MTKRNWPSWCLLFVLVVSQESSGADDDYNILHRDGSYQFGYQTPDSYHHADANRNNVVRGEFGSRNPGTGRIDSTVYTAGPRGFRPRGKNVVRKYDLNQNGPRPVGSRDDPYYDPFEDPSYNFDFKTRTYSRSENANRVGDVTGKYSYLDDVGERHNVEFVAGKNTGFHVKTPYPDSNPRAYGPLYFTGRGKPIPRGRTSIQRGLDGSYRFVSAGPDQRRTETSDATGHVRGSYTYLDNNGVQHSVHYIAGPETGYRVLKNVKGPHLPTIFPFGRPEIIPPDFYDTDLFDTAASGHVKPGTTGTGTGGTGGTGGGIDKDDFPAGGSDTSIGNKGPGGRPKPPKPTYDEDGGSDSDFGDDLFGGDGGGGSDGNDGLGGGGGGGGSSGSHRPSAGADDGSYRPSGDDGSYRPTSDGAELPRPGLGGTPKPPRPTKPYDGVNDLGDGDFSLFGSESNSRPPFGRPGSGSGGSGGRPIIQIGGDDGGVPGGSSPQGCDQCKGTIVTNIGDKIFSVPPGVSVRAHVQAIDLLPLMQKVPSPSQQYNDDMNLKTEQLNSAAASDVAVRMRIEDVTTSTSSPTTVGVAATTAPPTAPSSTTTIGSTQTPTAVSTTTATMGQTTDENSDIDIF